MIVVAKVIVDAGACGYITKIEATPNSGTEVKLNIKSDCPHVQALAEEYQTAEGMKEALAPFGEAKLFESAKKHLKHAACPVPPGIMKAVEVASGLAVPRDATIKVEK
ncbi:MAG TPA: hypothetical protein ENN91_02730 [Firmicutes bacterium]|nr:hypothetical protein [Bacillota bacterium]